MQARMNAPAEGSKFEPEWMVAPVPQNVPHSDTHAFISAISCPCAFPAECFESVMVNLVQNPNLTSSLLFRADILYDSEKDSSFDPANEEVSSFFKHMKQECRPWMLAMSGWKLDRTIVRSLVPRNPQLDQHLLQTCHFFSPAASATGSDELLIVYLPHISESESMPFYHPPVRTIAFHYTAANDATRDAAGPSGKLMIHVEIFESNGPVSRQLQQDTRLSRTLLKLLQVIHKHAVGQQRGYRKRVHHDLIIPQQKFQDTYTRLKRVHAKPLVDNWQEVTDPSKHVFEDLGIAAFLIELWTEMYTVKHLEFPGFVDIGCGNGILTYILIMEGYDGYGFDARQRRTWASFPEKVRNKITTSVLVPRIFQGALGFAANAEAGPRGVGDFSAQDSLSITYHDGIFKRGTFIISNHADELTAWTPILGSLSESPFLAIPCCSHSLAGERFRAPIKANYMDPRGKAAHQRANSPDKAAEVEGHGGKGARTGSLKQSHQKSMPSQYATLCGYVAFLAARVGYHVEKEILRIPSTRNTAILGRGGRCIDSAAALDERRALAVEVLEAELQQNLQTCAQLWLERAQQIVDSKRSSH